MTSIVVSLIKCKKVEHDKALFFTHKVFKHISKTLISLMSILQAVKSAIKNTGKSPVRIWKFTDHGPNMGFYGPHVVQSECRILQSHIINLYIDCILTIIILSIPDGIVFSKKTFHCFTFFGHFLPSLHKQFPIAVIVRLIN